MMTDTLTLGDLNELAYLALLGLLIVFAGLLAGLGSYYIADSASWRQRTGLLRELLIGVVCAITVPLFLSVLSSSLINSPKLVVVDYLRLFAVVVGYSMAIRRLFSRGAGRPEAWERGPGPISLIEVEIMRSVERQPLLYNTLPQLSPDLQVPAGKVAERVRGLLEKGLLGMRTNEHKQSELFVTGVGWSAINKALQHSDD